MINILTTIYLTIFATNVFATKIVSSNVLSILKDHGDADGSCDVLILPSDEGDVKTQMELPNEDLAQLQFSTAIALLPWDKLSLASFKCPWIVLSTINRERVAKFARYLSMETRVKTKLVVTSSSRVVQDFFRQLVSKAVFDAFLIHETNNTGHGVQTNQNDKYSVSENNAWNTVRVVFRFMPLSILPRGRGRYFGVDYEIMTEATRRTGVKFNLRMARSYADMIVELKNGTADMAIGSASFSHHRYQTAGDISAASGYWTIYLMTRIPGEIAADWTLIKPFDKISWLLLALSMLSVSVMLLILKWFLKKQFKLAEMHVYGISFVCLISESVPPSWFELRKLSRSAHVLLFTWMPTALLISFAYKSILLASLVSVEREQPITTFRQLIDSNMQLQLQDGVIHHEMMRTSPIQVVREAYQKCVIEKDGTYRTLTPEMQQARMDNRAAYLGSVRGESFSFMEGEHLASSPLGMHFVRNFPWKEELDQVIQDFSEKGLIARTSSLMHFRYDKEERDLKRAEKVEKTKELSPTHLILTWWLLGIALIASMLTFLWEKLNFWLFGNKYKVMVNERRRTLVAAL